MLEEEGLAAATVENNKKVYSVTEEGKAYLRANEARAEQFLRASTTGKNFERGRAPGLMRAFEDLGHAVRARRSRNNVTPKLLHEIAEVIHGAAKAIDEL